MTREEFDARYRLRSQQSNGGVESWLAEQVDTDRTVAVHRLVTGRRIGLLDMLGHLEPRERARVIEQVVVDGIPVVVTEPLPDSMPFVDWLQNSVPSTVTSVIRPLRPRTAEPLPESALGESASRRKVAAPPDQATEMVSPASSVNTQDPSTPPRERTDSSLIQGLTAIFAEEQIVAMRNALHQKTPAAPPIAAVDPNGSAPLPEPALVPPVAATPPAPQSPKVTPVDQADRGLTAIFQASEVRERLNALTSVRTPAPSAAAPPPPAHFEPEQASAPEEIASPPSFQPRTPERIVERSDPEPSPTSEEIGVPKYQLGFDAEPVRREEKAPAELPPPTLDSLQQDSSFTQVVSRRPVGLANHDPAIVAPPPPPQRKLSAIWVIVAIVTLVVAVLGILALVWSRR